ncbi:MAG TPA: hypothetical protein ENL27_02240 [Candidatus Parcubacteria bacterium]|nr:hypothetical protein [Candidatus Parcubacteria bacterium]
MVAASLYQKRGIIFFTLFLQFLFTLLLVLQYKGLMYSTAPTKEIFGVEFKVGDTSSLVFILIAFCSYSTATAIFAGYLANFFKRREKKFYGQTIELFKKTKELLQTKNLLKAALVKSDKSRLESMRTREELEKVNKELRDKIEELEKFHRITVGRELKMIELKKKIKNLEEKIKESEEINNK